MRPFPTLDYLKDGRHPKDCDILLSLKITFNTQSFQGCIFHTISNTTSSTMAFRFLTSALMFASLITAITIPNPEDHGLMSLRSTGLLAPRAQVVQCCQTGCVLCFDSACCICIPGTTFPRVCHPPVRYIYTSIFVCNFLGQVANLNDHV